MPVLSAPRLMRRLATEFRGLALRSLMGDADTCGSAETTAPMPNSAWRQQLVSERESLILQRQKAVSRHKRVSQYDARLREITNELLRGQ